MKSLTASLAAAATALALSSCTSPAATSGDGHTDHDHAGTSAVAQPAQNDPQNDSAQNNAADVTFATDMIPHHEQAVKLSSLVPQRSTDPAVVKLASEISGAQAPEIETMKAFLVQWGAPPPADHEGHGAAMDGMQMQGMVDGATMTKLESLRGREFDQLFLQSMIGHHEGAVAMANTELAKGVNADAKSLATQIIKAQQSEIGQMKQMLGA